MRIHLSTLAIIIIFLITGAGCFKTTIDYTGGGASGKPRKFTAQYRLLGCMNDDKTFMLLPDSRTEYFLTDDAFYEITGEDEGWKVTNRWKDATGQYFFIYEKNLNKNGFLYFVPADPSTKHLHLRYRGGAYQVRKVEGTWRPFGGAPQACVLKKIE